MVRALPATSETPIAVLGPGLMGAQIGIEFAMHGFPVTFLARDVERARERLDATVAWTVDLGLVDEPTGHVIQRSIRVVRRVEDIPADVRLVLESLPEDVALKVELLRPVAERAGAAVLGTNTSSIAIDEIGRQIDAEDRLVGMHYWNPPILMPLVELAPGPRTSPSATAFAAAVLERAGKHVIELGRDVPGLVWNRLQFAILREALWLVEHEVTTVEGIDEVVRLGLARRWRQVGLFESIFLGGPEIWERVAANLFPLLSDATTANGLAERVGAASTQWTSSARRRDEGLAADLGTMDEELSAQRTEMSRRGNEH
jgi:3-hydroxybutyryl-CoA dehydrogenase